jgi:hypothetical protein
MGVVEVEFTKPYFSGVLHLMLTFARIPTPTLDGLPPEQLITALEWGPSSTIDLGAAPAGVPIPAWELAASVRVTIHHVSIAEREADPAAAGATTSAKVWMRVSASEAGVAVSAYRIDVAGAREQTVLWPLWGQKLPLPDGVKVLRGAVLRAGDSDEEVVTIRLCTDPLSEVLARPANRVTARKQGWLIRISGETLGDMLKAALENYLAHNQDPKMSVEESPRVAWMLGPWADAVLGWEVGGNFAILQKDACPGLFGNVDLSVAVQAVLALQPSELPLSDPANAKLGLRLWLSTDLSDWDVFRCWAGSGGIGPLLMGGQEAGPLALIGLGAFAGIESLVVIGAMAGARAQDKIEAPQKWIKEPSTDGEAIFYNEIDLPKPPGSTVAEPIDVNEDGLIIAGGGLFFIAKATHQPEFSPVPGPLPAIWLGGEFNCDTDKWEPQLKILRRVEITDEAAVPGQEPTTVPTQIFGTTRIVGSDAFTLTWHNSPDYPGAPEDPAMLTIRQTGPLEGPVSCRLYLHTSAGLRTYTITASVAPTPDPDDVRQARIRCSLNKIRSYEATGSAGHPQLAIELERLAGLQAEGHQFTEAAASAGRAASVYAAMADVIGQGRLLTYQGSYLSRTGAHAEAIAVTQQAVDLYRGHDDQGQLAWALENLAIRYSEAQQFTEAANSAGQAAQMYAAIGDDIGQDRLLAMQSSYKARLSDLHS